jgi:membrane associated rhomboid family serine protease
MGWWRMALIYIISGGGGFVFGGSLSDIRTASVGASGSLYGIK